VKEKDEIQKLAIIQETEANKLLEEIKQLQNDNQNIRL
jgi:hypothetical protein